jgi:hypothetical protein
VSIQVKAEALGHKFFVDEFSRVIARDKKGGEIESQTVEALLLLAILQRLPVGKGAGNAE